MLHTAGHDQALTGQVHAMFHRVIAAWAADVLLLRHSGLDRPSARRGRNVPIAPAGHHHHGTWQDDDLDPIGWPIRWRPQHNAPRGRFGDL